MSLYDVKLVYVSCVFVIGLVILMPTLAILITFPSTRFSELYLLGPDHLEGNYPFNVSRDISYRIYLDVANHMGVLQYYKIYVSFKTQPEPSQNNGTEMASPSNESLDYEVFLSDNDIWEKDVVFSFDDLSFEGNYCTVNQVTVDNHKMSLKRGALWDSVNAGFYYQFFFELWAFNRTSLQLEFSSSVWIPLNITRGVL